MTNFPVANTVLPLTTTNEGFLSISGVVSSWETKDDTLRAFLRLALCAKKYDPSHSFWSGWGYGDEGEEQSVYREAHNTLVKVCETARVSLDDVMGMCTRFGRATMGSRYWK